ncbi:MAG: hypothetical protein ACOX37_00005, partial [Bacillota bacterium]
METRLELQQLAWMKVGVVRERKGLEEALSKLEEMAKDVEPKLA